MEVTLTIPEWLPSVGIWFAAGLAYLLCGAVTAGLTVRFMAGPPPDGSVFYPIVLFWPLPFVFLIGPWLVWLAIGWTMEPFMRLIRLVAGRHW